MKKYFAISMIALAAVLSGCNKEVEVTPGKAVGEIYVTAKSGAMTVLVKKSGLWRVSSNEIWISTDVQGRQGEGAFTVYYGSNESDFISANATRRGAVVIRSYDDNVADTLYIRQQGIPDGKEYASASQDSYIEFIDAELTKVRVTYANLNGCSDASAAEGYIKSCNADLVALCWNDEAGMTALESSFEENVVRNDSVAFVNLSSFEMLPGIKGSEPASAAVQVDGINFQVALFDEDGVLYQQMSSLLESGYNDPASGADWIVGGTFYCLSSMEVGYPDTPSWYPKDPTLSIFDTDRYAQSNNLTDCVWMSSRKFNPTWSEDDRSWRADYIYASNSVWNAATSVKVGEVPVAGAQHRTLELTIKY